MVARLPENGAAATLIIIRADGSTSTRRLQRNGQGEARGTTRFGRGGDQAHRGRALEREHPDGTVLDLPGPPAYSCWGRPRDDHRVFELRGKLL